MVAGCAALRGARISTTDLVVGALNRRERRKRGAWSRLPLERFLKMMDFEVAPVFGEVFGDEAAVALVGFIFAAEEARVLEEFGLDVFFDGAFGHEVEEVLFVGVPAALFFFVLVKHGLGRGEDGKVEVVGAED